MSPSAGHEHDAADGHDRAIHHIFGSGLTLTNILSRHGLDEELAERLRGVVAELDSAIGHIRSAALALVVERRQQQPAAPTEHPLPDNWRRRLCRCSIDEVFAYAVTGDDFYHANSHTPWAHERNGLLVSVRSGSVLARREGRIFYDIKSDTPLYYEDQRTEPTRERNA